MAKKRSTKPLQFKLRIRETLRAKLEKAAKAKGISVNAEAVDRLEQSFERESLVDNLGADIYRRLMEEARMRPITQQTILTGERERKEIAPEAVGILGRVEAALRDLGNVGRSSDAAPQDSKSTEQKKRA